MKKYHHTLFYAHKLLVCCGDIEINFCSKCLPLLFCSWNLNYLTAHNFNKFSLIKVYVVRHDFDIVCLPETFLNCASENDHDGLKVAEILNDQTIQVT